MPLLDDLIAILTQRDPFPPLVPEKVWDKSLIAKIDTLSAAPLIKAGLHLLNDDIHNCHIIAQEHERQLLARNPAPPGAGLLEFKILV